MDLFHSNGYLDIFSERSKFSKKIAMLKKILGMLRTKIERKSAPMGMKTPLYIMHKKSHINSVTWKSLNLYPNIQHNLPMSK